MNVAESESGIRDKHSRLEVKSLEINKKDVVGIYGGQLFNIVNIQNETIDSWKIARAL